MTNKKPKFNAQGMYDDLLGNTTVSPTNIEEEIIDSLQAPARKRKDVTNQVIDISLDKLKANDLNRFKAGISTNQRRYIDELKESISTFGLHEPLHVVLNNEEKGEYRITSGHTRALALIELGHKKAPCIVFASIEDELKERTRIAIANTHREMDDEMMLIMINEWVEIYEKTKDIGEIKRGVVEHQRTNWIATHSRISPRTVDRILAKLKDKTTKDGSGAEKKSKETKPNVSKDIASILKSIAKIQETFKVVIKEKQTEDSIELMKQLKTDLQVLKKEIEEEMIPQTQDLIQE